MSSSGYASSSAAMLAAFAAEQEQWSSAACRLARRCAAQVRAQMNARIRAFAAGFCQGGCSVPCGVRMSGKRRSAGSRLRWPLQQQQPGLSAVQVSKKQQEGAAGTSTRSHVQAAAGDWTCQACIILSSCRFLVGAAHAAVLHKSAAGAGCLLPTVTPANLELPVLQACLRHVSPCWDFFVEAFSCRGVQKLCVRC